MNDENKKSIKKVRIVAIQKEKEESFAKVAGVKVICCSAEEWSKSLSGFKGYSEADDFVKLLRTIANPIRFKILLILMERDWACNCEFELAFKEHQTLISHHLRNLRESGLITFEKKGQWKFYKIEEDARPFLEKIRDLINIKPSSCC